MSVKKKYLFFVFLSFTTLLLFKDSFSVFFFQDDFFAMKISDARTATDVLKFFIPRSDVQFYRPISHEGLFYLLKRLFGFNPFPYHLTVWLFWLALIFLISKNVKLYLKDIMLRHVFVFLFATSAIHYNSLFWIINGSYIIMAVFFFSAFYIYKTNKSKSKPLIVALFYLLGLLSNEFMIVLPVLIVFDRLVLKEQTKRELIVTIGSFGLLTLVYAVVRMFIYRPNVGTYTFVLSAAVLSSYRWFVLFLINWAETIKDQFLNLYTIRQDFIKAFPLEVGMFIVNTSAIFIIFILLPSFFFFNRNISNRIVPWKLTIFGSIWFLISLLPIIFIPGHISPHQGTIALFGFLLIMMSLYTPLHRQLKKWQSSALLSIFASVWVASSIQAVNLSNRVHWIVRRGNLSKTWIEKTKSKYPNPPPAATIKVGSEETEVKVALNDGEGIRQAYGDPTLKVNFKNPIKVVP